MLSNAEIRKRLLNGERGGIFTRETVPEWYRDMLDKHDHDFNQKANQYIEEAIKKELEKAKGGITYTQKDVDAPPDIYNKIFDYVFKKLKDAFKKAGKKGGKFTADDINKLGLDLSQKDYDANDVLKGVNVELEHEDVTDGDLKKTYKIARAHLEENPDYYDLLEIMEDPKNYSRIMALRGEGLRSTIKSLYKALKEGRKGEKHAILYKDGEFKRASYMGPGTHISDRLREGVEPITKSDKVAQAHDIRYSLANSQKDVAMADKKMIAKLKKIQKNKGDSIFNIQLGMKPIQAKYYLEKYGIVKPGTFASFGDVDEKDKPMLRKKLKELELQGYGFGGCHACGGNFNIIMQKNKKAITDQIRESIELITRDKKKSQIFGSYVYRSQFYPSDIDIHEVVNVAPSRQKNVYKNMVKTIQDITKKIKKKRSIYFGEFKAGNDERFDIDVNDPDFLNKIDNLFLNKLLSKREYTQFVGLHALYKQQNDCCAFDELTEELRQKKVIRWTQAEILKGHKKLVGNVKIKLEDAFKGETPIKIDIWAPINGRYIEITNFFFLVVYDKKAGTIKILNHKYGDYVKNILEQVEKYSSKLFFNPFKMGKRIWGIARETKNLNLLNKLTPLYQSSIAKISQINAEIEVIILMLERLKSIPMKTILSQIDEFKIRLSYIYDIDFDEERVYRWIDGALRSYKNKRLFIHKLTEIRRMLKDVVNVESVKYLKEKGLYPVPEFIYNIVGPQKDIGDQPLFRNALKLKPTQRVRFQEYAFEEETPFIPPPPPLPPPESERPRPPSIPPSPDVPIFHMYGQEDELDDSGWDDVGDEITGAIWQQIDKDKKLTYKGHELVKLKGKLKKDAYQEMKRLISIFVKKLLKRPNLTDREYNRLTEILELVETTKLKPFHLGIEIQSLTRGTFSTVPIKDVATFTRIFEILARLGKRKKDTHVYEYIHKEASPFEHTFRYTKEFHEAQMRQKQAELIRKEREKQDRYKPEWI